MNSTLDSCPVCCDTFTSTLRKPVTCPKCNYSACIQCTKRYLLGIIDDPHCMNCIETDPETGKIKKFGWTRNFLLQNLTLSFMNNEWATHRSQILWRQEEAFLPEAQVVAERIVRGRNMENNLEPLIEERAKLRRQIEVIDDQITQFYRVITLLQAGREVNDLGQIVTTKTATERKAFVRRCTFPGCNGFLSTAWKCGICENYSCSECLVIKGKDREAAHTCKDDDVATAKLLAKDTKMCPKCGEGIQRSEGCSQMFCTSCKTPFDWNTGKIISGGYIHNPHYFAYLRENGGAVNRVAGDIQCGGLPHIRSLTKFKNKTTETTLQSIYQSISHTIDVEARRYNAHVEEVNNEQLRIKYLLNEITKSEIEHQLINHERKRERDRVIREVLDTFGNIGAEIFRRFVADAEPKIASNTKAFDDTWPTYKKELEALRDYCNKELMNISYYYKCMVPQWNVTDWRFMTESIADMKRRERIRIENIIYELKHGITSAAPAARAESPVRRTALPVRHAVPALVIPPIPGIPGLLPIPTPPGSNA